MIQLFQEDCQKLLDRIEEQSIDLIYCDILYNTGKNFGEYNDNLGTIKDALDWYSPKFYKMYHQPELEAITSLDYYYLFSMVKNLEYNLSQ